MAFAPPFRMRAGKDLPKVQKLVHEDEPPSPGRSLSPIAVVYGLALAGCAVLGVKVARDALIDSRVEAVAVRDRGGRADLPWQRPLEGDPCAVHCPPEALAASAVHLVTQAGGPTDPKGERLPEAQKRLEAAIAARPGAGGWLAWLAYARALREGVTPSVILVFARSYEATPYLPREGFWRVRFGAMNWSGLTDATRRRVVAEAVWLKAIDPEGNAPTLDPATDPRATAAITVALAKPVTGLVPHSRSRSPGSVGPVSE